MKIEKYILNEGVKKFIKEHTTVNDWRNIAIDVGIGVFTIDKVIRQNYPVNEKRIIVVNELMKIAIDRAEKKLKEMTGDIKIFKEKKKKK